MSLIQGSTVQQWQTDSDLTAHAWRHVRQGTQASMTGIAYDTLSDMACKQHREDKQNKSKLCFIISRVLTLNTV